MGPWVSPPGTAWPWWRAPGLAPPTSSDSPGGSATAWRHDWPSVSLPSRSSGASSARRTISPRTEAMPADRLAESLGVVETGATGALVVSRAAGGVAFPARSPARSPGGGVEKEVVTRAPAWYPRGSRGERLRALAQLHRARPDHACQHVHGPRPGPR